VPDSGCHVASIDRVQHIEHDQRHVDPPLAVEHPIAGPGEAGQAFIAERDQLAIDREAVDAPAAPRTDAAAFPPVQGAAQRRKSGLRPRRLSAATGYGDGE
jgi:hypothetical protein